VIGVVEQINAVRRRVGSRVLEAGEARTVLIGRTYDAPVEDVWDACTNPERIPRWFLPVSGQLRVGGRYQLEGNASGTIERCEPPRTFAATWEYGGMVSWIEVRLSPQADGRTRFELEHIGADDDQKWRQCGPGAVGVGWDLGLLGLAIHLDSGGSVDPHEVAAWSASEKGKRCISLSSQSWCDASVAAGADPADAQAAADSTTAFYTATASPG
jgi:uncharacterized protein YndB with AHSA1/START domain